MGMENACRWTTQLSGCWMQDMDTFSMPVDDEAIWYMD